MQLALYIWTSIALSNCKSKKAKLSAGIAAKRKLLRWLLNVPFDKEAV